MTNHAVEFLSPAWIAALAAIAAELDVEPGGAQLHVGHAITTAAGVVRYGIEIANGRMAVTSGEGADVTITSDFATAWALHCGELDAQSAFRAGRLRVRGDISRLAAAADLVAKLPDMFAALRARTVPLAHP